MSYNSKYKGSEVEELLDQVKNGGGASSGGSGAYAEVNHGTSDTTFTLTPNTFHVWDEVDSLDLSFGSEISGVANEYLFQFTSGAIATTLTLPDNIKWANNNVPSISANTICQISVLKGLASMLEFSNEVSIFPISIVEGDNGEDGIILYNYFSNFSTGGQTVTFKPEEGSITIDGSNCTDVFTYSYTEQVCLLTEEHNVEGTDCYYLESNGYLELYIN